jgi:hypothetical protein
MRSKLRSIGADPFVLSALAAAAVGVIALVFRERAGEPGLIPLTLLAAALPVIALFSRNWWVYALQMTAAAFAALALGLVALDYSGAADAMGPAGMAYLLPMLVFMGLTAASGAIRFIVQAVRQARGLRGSAPFVSRDVVRGLLIFGALYAAFMAWNVIQVLTYDAP